MGPGHGGHQRRSQAQGFDYFFGYANHTDAHDYYPDHLWRNDQQVPLDGKQYSHDLIAAEALNFVRESAAKPFALYLTFTIPHARLEPPSEEPYQKESWPEKERKFAAMITRMDRDVGRLIQLLAELKLDQNTLVILTSDNGPHEEGHSADFFDSNGALRGIKRDVYEGGIRVPFIACWPDKIAAGSTSDHVGAFWDFVPTCAELVDAAPPKETDGISFLPTLLGHNDQQRKHEHLYWEFQERGGKQAARFGEWKAVRLNVTSNADGPIELYDLAKDPAEKINVATEHPDVVKRAAQVLADEHDPSQIFPLLADEVNGKPAPARKNRRAGKR